VWVSESESNPISLPLTCSRQTLTIQRCTFNRNLCLYISITPELLQVVQCLASRSPSDFLLRNNPSESKPRRPELVIEQPQIGSQMTGNLTISGIAAHTAPTGAASFFGYLKKYRKNKKRQHPSSELIYYEGKSLICSL